MKLKRVTFYFVDHDEVDNNKVEELLQNYHFPNDCISPKQVSVEETDIGEWDDEHRCNYCDYDFSKEFNKVSNEKCESENIPITFEERVIGVVKNISNYGKAIECILWGMKPVHYSYPLDNHCCQLKHHKIVHKNDK